MLSGLGIISTLCCVVAIATMAILTFRLAIQNNEQYSQFASIIGGLLNAVAIQILNRIYRTVAQKMNEWENHRTVPDFHDNLLFKIFLFNL